MRAFSRVLVIAAAGIFAATGALAASAPAKGPRPKDGKPDLTGIGPGETDPEFRFSLQTVGCVGCCALGPVMVIDGDYHGKMAPAQSQEILRNYV